MPSLFSANCYATIPGYPGYLVGTDGTVLSEHSSGPRERQLTGRYRHLQLSKTNKHGHRSVELTSLDGQSKRLLVHRLVLEAFLGPCPPGMECRHFPDHNPANNRLENLQWNTHKVNMADKDIHGTNFFLKTQHGKNHFGAKLKDKEVEEIRFLENKLSQEKIGEIFGVRQSTISRILRHQRRKGV